MACDPCSGASPVVVKSDIDTSECAIEVCSLNGLGVRMKFDVIGIPNEVLWYFGDFLKYCPACGDEL